jgi:heptosyltransferase-1
VVSEASDPKSILLVRLSAIGDNVFSTSLIPPLRARYPSARLYWVTQPESVPLLASNPRLDGVVEMPLRRLQQLFRERRLRALWREWTRFRARLRALQADLAIDLQGRLKSGVIVRASGARHRVGLGSREGSQWLMHDVIPRRVDDTDINAEYRDLARWLGLETGDFPMDLAVAPESELAVDALQAAHGLERGFIALVPFTTRPQKHWIDTHWTALVSSLAKQIARPMVLLGGPGDGDRARLILRGVDAAAPVVSLTGEACISLVEASSLIRRADLLIGVDTGMTHMSIAHRRPTIGIFGSTLPYLSTRTPKTFMHYAGLDCAPCRRHPTCDGAFTCMREVSPAAVLDTAIRLLGDGVPPPVDPAAPGVVAG